MPSLLILLFLFEVLLCISAAATTVIFHLWFSQAQCADDGSGYFYRAFVKFLIISNKSFQQSRSGNILRVLKAQRVLASGRHDPV